MNAAAAQGTLAPGPGATGLENPNAQEVQRVASLGGQQGGGFEPEGESGGGENAESETEGEAEGGQRGVVGAGASMPDPFVI